MAHYCATPERLLATISKVIGRRMQKAGEPRNRFMLYLVAKELYSLKRADGTLTPCTEHPGKMLIDEKESKSDGREA